MKNPIEYVEKLIRQLERKIFFYILVIVGIIGGILVWTNYKHTVSTYASNISFNKTFVGKAYCITANTKLTDYTINQFDKLEILKDEKFSCFKDMETCYTNIQYVWYDAVDFLSDYYQVEDNIITKAVKYNDKNHQIINAWWENSILKVYCMEVSVKPTEEGGKND